MRELKFRAWSNKYSHYCSGLQYDSDFGWQGTLESAFEYQTDLEPLVELYTGLKDKNGRPIYVGDIVKYDYIGCNYIVVLRKYDASFVLENDDREEIIHLHYDRQSDYEVAGNIHENPELLEEE